MSSFPLFSTAEADPHAVFDQRWPAQIRERLAANPMLAAVVPASQLEVRPALEMVSCGIREIDALAGGLPRGCLSEIFGGASSGCTSLLLSTLAAATQRQEACALVDVSDAFDPVSAASAGVQFERLLWVRCSRKKSNSPSRHRDTEGTKEFAVQQIENHVEQALRVTDLLLQSGGFGLVLIDLGDVPAKIARRIPLTSWFRFQRAVERTPTVLFVVSQSSCTQSCAALLLKMKAAAKKLSALSFQPSAQFPSHAQLLDRLHIEAEILRSRMQRKPVQSVTIFATAARMG